MESVDPTLQISPRKPRPSGHGVTAPVDLPDNANGSIVEGGTKQDREWVSVVTTFLTTLSMFFVFFGQGYIIARILGPLGRGEFGTALQFPRDILLYAGLLGGVEIANSYASKGLTNTIALKYAAARMGIISGILTGGIAAIGSTLFLFYVGKTYLIPFCLISCLFVPWEHMHLTISGVDRGSKAYGRYNINRLLFALAFPVLVLLVFVPGFDSMLGASPLLIMCVLFVVSKMVGLLPTLRGMNVVSLLRRSTSEDQSQTIETPTISKMLQEGRPFALSTFATELFERLDLLLVVALGSVVESGYYFVAVPAATLVTIAPNALGVFTFNAGADQKRIVTLRETVGVMGAALLIQIFAVGALMWMIPILISTFLPQFEPSIKFAIWLLPAFAIKGFLQAVDGFLKGRGKPMIGVWARVISISVMLICVWLAFEEYGLLSIPIAACAGQVLSMLIITTFVFKDVIERESKADATHSSPDKKLN